MPTRHLRRPTGRFRAWHRPLVAPPPASASPEVFEPCRTQLGISHRVLDCLVPKPVLDWTAYRGPRFFADLLDLHEAPYPFAMAGPIVNHFHCVWIDERFQNALRRLRADHVFVRRASIVQDLGRSGGGLFLVRLDQERLCIGSIPPMRI